MPEGAPPIRSPKFEVASTESPAHDSARKHVSGEALFIDDIPEPAGLLHVYLGLSEHAHARINSLDLTKVISAPGVVRVFTPPMSAARTMWEAWAWATNRFLPIGSWSMSGSRSSQWQLRLAIRPVVQFGWPRSTMKF